MIPSSATLLPVLMSIIFSVAHIPRCLKELKKSVETVWIKEFYRSTGLKNFRDQLDDRTLEIIHLSGSVDTLHTLLSGIR